MTNHSTSLSSDQSSKDKIPSPVEIGYTPAQNLQWKLGEETVDCQRPLRVVCIGAGVSGIYAGIRISNSLSNVDLTIYDKNPDFGGTWFENRYAGCACDIPAHCYQYSFEPNPNWSSFYAPADEIRAYFKGVALKYGLEKMSKFEHAVQGAQWNQEEGIWDLEVKRPDGTTFTDRANIVIQAVGGLNNWKWPEIEGLHTFSGHLVHSAVWDKEYDFTGKRVALIGSGSTAIQILPQIAPIAQQVDQYVRSATWIGFPFAAEEIQSLHKGETPDHYTDAEKKEFATKPETSQAYRHRLMSNLNQVHTVTINDSPMQLGAREAFWQNMQTKLQSKPEIAQFMKPDFPVGCRRLTPGPMYLESLVRENVGFITSTIDHIDKGGIRDHVGVERRYDAIICATGFDTTYLPRFPLIGKDGQDLRKRWQSFPETYCSIAVDGFPNYFFINGPNSAVGSGDLIVVFQTEVDYVIQCIRKLQSQGYKSMNVKSLAVAEFQQYSQTYFKKTVFGTKCRTWYKSGRSTGPVTALWPGSTLHAVKTLMDPRWEDYDFESIKENRFHYLGNGFTTAEVTKGEDAAWYIQIPNPRLVAKLGQAAESEYQIAVRACAKSQDM